MNNVHNVDMNKVRYMWDNPVTLLELARGTVCANARFVFDAPVVLKSGEMLEMEDGRFSFVGAMNGVEFKHSLPGRWDR